MVCANDIDTFLTVSGIGNCVTVHQHPLPKDFRINRIILRARQTRGTEERVQANLDDEDPQLNRLITRIPAPSRRGGNNLWVSFCDSSGGCLSVGMAQSSDYGVYLDGV